MRKSTLVVADGSTSTREVQTKTLSVLQMREEKKRMQALVDAELSGTSLSNSEYMIVMLTNVSIRAHRSASADAEGESE